MTETTTAPEGYGRIEWPEVRAGDVLMHENGDRLTVRGVVESISVWGMSLGATTWQTLGFAPYRKQPELPTEPGAYLDKNGVLLILTTDADSVPWLAVNINSDLSELRWMGGDRVVQRAPFTRLVPMPTEEQVHAAVYNALRGSAADGMYPLRTINAVMALLGGGDNE